MYIYKITNKSNNKIYVGKTVKGINERLTKHIWDANNGLDTHLSRAIRKYGKDSFEIEVIESVDEEDLLSEREIYWIERLESFTKGYNSTLGGEGGNTYIKKTEDELREISRKISESKAGSKNPNSTSIKCKNVFTEEELFFGSLAEAKEYFGENNHNFITRRVLEEIKYCYKGEWIFAYLDKEYIKDYTKTKGESNHRAVGVSLKKSDGSEYSYKTLSSAEKDLNFPRGTLSNLKRSGRSSYRDYEIKFVK